MTGEVIAKREFGKIKKNEPWNTYEVKKPELMNKEKEFIDLVKRTLQKERSTEDLSMIYIKDKEKENFIESVQDLEDVLPSKMSSFPPDDDIKEEVSNFIKEVAPYVENVDEVSTRLLNDLLGLGKLALLVEDDNLEEIMVNAPEYPVFVFDREHGVCEANITLDETDLDLLLDRIADYVDKDINYDNPLLDARLPDGSRVNASIPPASPHAKTLTIRKFRKKPFTITELIENNTISSEAAAFLWVCVEGMKAFPMNMLISGSTGSGKTTTLNALSVFIPPEDRIVTIEDTLELNFYDRENWIQLESRSSEYGKKIDLNKLLKNSIRMRPDRIIVGEVRGEEAETMFTAMDIGHQGTMSTLHANSGKETLLRLRSKPMNVPKSMFTLLDLIIMQHRMNLPDKGLTRKVTEISEVSVMGEHILLNNVYESPEKGKMVERTDIPSSTVEKLAEHSGKKKKDIKREIKIREAILDYMVDESIKSYPEIRDLVTKYYQGPEEVLEEIED